MELDKWLSNLDVNAASVLDIGGSQLPVKGRTRSWNVEEYVIADLPNPHVGSPKPDIEVDLNYLEDTGFDFDTVFCLEVFDYVYNPLSAFSNIKDFMSSNGNAWVTFPSFYPLHQPVEDDALRYMPGAIKKLAKATGLTIEQMIPRYTETDAIYQAFRMERMRCAKHEDHNISGYIVEFTK